MKKNNLLFLDKIPWAKDHEFETIEKSILISVYSKKPDSASKTKKFDEAMIEIFSLDMKKVKYLNSFKDNSGSSRFNHVIRAHRNTLHREGFLKSPKSSLLSWFK